MKKNMTKVDLKTLIVTTILGLVFLFICGEALELFRFYNICTLVKSEQKQFLDGPCANTTNRARFSQWMNCKEVELSYYTEGTLNCVATEWRERYGDILHQIFDFVSGTMYNMLFFSVLVLLGIAIAIFFKYSDSLGIYISKFTGNWRKEFVTKAA